MDPDLHEGKRQGSLAATMHKRRKKDGDLSATKEHKDHKDKTGNIEKC
jgi:hypothetical protein